MAVGKAACCWSLWLFWCKTRATSRASASCASSELRTLASSARRDVAASFSARASLLASSRSFLNLCTSSFASFKSSRKFLFWRVRAAASSRALQAVAASGLAGEHWWRPGKWVAPYLSRARRICASAVARPPLGRASPRPRPAPRPEPRGGASASRFSRLVVSCFADHCAGMKAKPFSVCTKVPGPVGRPAQTRRETARRQSEQRESHDFGVKSHLAERLTFACVHLDPAKVSTPCIWVHAPLARGGRAC